MQMRKFKVSVDVFARSVRHAPCSALWQQYFLALERSDLFSEEIDAKWSDARGTITTPEEGFSLYRTYIYLLRRRIAKQGLFLVVIFQLNPSGG